MPLIQFEDATFRKFQYTVFPNTGWKINEGENWAIAGANGSGKTTFLEAVEGRLVKIKGSTEYCLPNAGGIIDPEPHHLIASVYFSDHSINYGDFYYQQRYHRIGKTFTGYILSRKDFNLCIASPG
jgi:energy-coupling factor transporter ATP-binding protein EcfA2